MPNRHPSRTRHCRSRYWRDRQGHSSCKCLLSSRCRSRRRRYRSPCSHGKPWLRLSGTDPLSSPCLSRKQHYRSRHSCDTSECSSYTSRQSSPCPRRTNCCRRRYWCDTPWSRLWRISRRSRPCPCRTSCCRSRHSCGRHACPCKRRCPWSSSCHCRSDRWGRTASRCDTRTPPHNCPPSRRCPNRSSPCCSRRLNDTWRRDRRAGSCRRRHCNRYRPSRCRCHPDKYDRRRNRCRPRTWLVDMSRQPLPSSCNPCSGNRSRSHKPRSIGLARQWLRPCSWP